MLPIPVTQTAWQPGQILEESRLVVDAETLAEIDERLCAFFSLDPP